MPISMVEYFFLLKLIFEIEIEIENTYLSHLLRINIRK